MNKYKFLKISSSKKIRFLINKYKKKPYVVFLHGFMSDLDGEKPKKILKFCNRKKIGFFAIEYSGHGKSTGKFTNSFIVFDISEPHKFRQVVTFRFFVTLFITSFTIFNCSFSCTLANEGALN